MLYNTIVKVVNNIEPNKRDKIFLILNLNAITGFDDNTTLIKITHNVRNYVYKELISTHPDISKEILLLAQDEPDIDFWVENNLHPLIEKLLLTL
jgi:hypothetical protein